MTAGILLGMGFAGFFDGIVLHQVLQWHHMLSSVRPTNSIADLEINTLWDGLFHIAAYGLTAAGSILLWRANRQGNLPLSSQPLIGSVLMGAGLFNFFEGLINHQILGIHHVKPGPNQLAWDMGFLILGIFLAVAGWLMLRNQQPSATE